jgi:choice-of-anchor B domain-containing protein
MTTPFRLLLAFLFLNLSGSLLAQNVNIAYRSKTGYSGQTCANICGWAGGGHEYALVGASKGLGIVDVTDPDALVKIVQLPGPDNFWKEIKTYKHYAYVTSEGGQGVQIVDLSDLPSPTPDYHFYTGDGAILGQLGTIHALHIDTTKGYLYLYGSTLFNGGAVVCDLNADPYNPVYVGKFDQLGYVHDGWVDNDTLYASNIYIGLFSIVNMANKSNPVLLNVQQTPNNFTHNTWMSKDRQTIFTTDEVDNSYLAAYDISDPTDIKFLDKMQANPGSGSIVHNTHILENYAITSWYSDGVSIVDVTRPENLVQTGWYDNAPGITGGGFVGCWGVYPFLPSGNIIATNIYGPNDTGGELWVLTPSYKRACYLEGKITSASNGQPINGALVEILSSTIKEETIATGQYSLGRVNPGTVQVKVSKIGYNPVTTSAVLVEGEVTILDVSLESAASVTVSGQVREAGTGLAIPNAHVTVYNSQITFETLADANGQFNFPTVFLGTYSVVAGAWGHLYAQKTNQNLQTNQTYTFELEKGYRDDFIFDYGWEVSGTSTEGIWERGEPVGINPGIVLAPETDWGSDIGNQCYITGNSSSSVDADDVESGTMILQSPPMDLTYLNAPVLRGFLFFVSITQDQELLDSIKLYVSNGIEEQLLLDLPGTNFTWKILNEPLKTKIAITNNMRIRIECFDNPAFLGFDSYEAAFDFFRIIEGNPVGTDDPTLEATLTARPNPFKGSILIEYKAPASGTYRLALYDVLGRQVEATTLEGIEGMAVLGETLNQGIYFARLEQEGQSSRPIRIVKID